MLYASNGYPSREEVWESVMGEWFLGKKRFLLSLIAKVRRVDRVYIAYPSGWRKRKERN
jgi:hypothetical protein